MLWDVAVKDFGGSGGSWVCCGLRKVLRVHVGAVWGVLRWWWGSGGSGASWGVVCE